MHAHTHSHTNTPSKRARGEKKDCTEAACRRAACQKSGRERYIDREREREQQGREKARRQESPYIAHRKSCVRAGRTLFGHGDFLVG